MRYQYAWSWHDGERHPIDELTEEQARARFDEGPQLGVIALSDDAPESGGVPVYTLELSARAHDVRVTHFAETGSVVAQLDYLLEGDRLFLEEVAEWLYPEDGEHHTMLGATASRGYFYRADGTAQLRSRVGTGPETVEEFEGVDVGGHWVDPVTWGDWDRIGTHRT